MTSARAASQLAAARQLLLREDPKAALEARKKAEAALQGYKERGDEDGELTATQEVITASLAGKQPLEAVRMAKDKLFLFQQAGNKKGEAAMLQSLSLAQLAAKEPGPALDSAKKAAAAYQRLQDAKGEFRTLQKALVSACIAIGDKKEAIAAANTALALSKRLPDDAAKADAFAAVMRARLAGDARDTLAAASEALALYRKTGDRNGEAAVLAATAQAHLSKRDPGSALAPAKEALAIFNDLEGCTKSAVEALDLVVKALVQDKQPAEALTACQDQLRLFKQKKDLQGEASVYVPLFFAHRSQEDQEAHANEALELAGDALERFRELGDRKGEADMWVCVAETHLAWGLNEEAMQEAQEALMIYRDLKDKQGQDAANVALSEVYIRRGEPALAPMHDEGLELLGRLARAVDERDGPAYQAANERLMSIGGLGLLTETEQAAALAPVVSKDPDAAMEFMSANAPEGQEQEEVGKAAGPMGLNTVVKMYSYLGFRAGGIAYGPRFRCIEFGSSFKGVDVQEDSTLGVSCLALQDVSDDWEWSLKLHPAILDCALQSTSCVGQYLAPRKDAKDQKGKGK